VSALYEEAGPFRWPAPRWLSSRPPFPGRRPSLAPSVLARLAPSWPVLLVVAALAIWYGSLGDINLDAMTDIGLVSVLPIQPYIAVLLLTVAFTQAVHRRETPTIVLILPIAALILMIHGTPAILYGSLRYSWAWKHVGIIDYIQRHHSIDPYIQALYVYHNWPGFFALASFVTELSGLGSPLAYANWAPVFFNVLWLSGLMIVSSAWTSDRRLLGLTAWFFLVTNWVGQDYYSPQALAYFLHLVILGVCLRWFGVASPRWGPIADHWPTIANAVHALDGLVTRAAPGTIPTASSRMSSAAMMAIILLLFAVIVATHQLTPFMTMLAVSALIAARCCRAWSLPIAMGLVTVVWVLWMAAGFISRQPAWVLLSVGQPGSNIEGNLIDLNKVSAGQQLVAMVGRSLTIGMCLLAVCGMYRRIQQGRWDLPGLLLMVAPLPIIAGNSYGGEVLFRIYLFALPMLAFFAAALFYPAPWSGRSWLTPIGTALLSLALLAGLSFAYFGKELMYRFTPDETDASKYLHSIAPPGTLVVDLLSNWPWSFTHYEDFTYVDLTGIEMRDRPAMRINPIPYIIREMSAPGHTASYLIITRSQKAELKTTGELFPLGVDELEPDLKRSGYFQVIYESRDATIFTLALPPGVDPPATGIPDAPPAAPSGTSGEARMAFPDAMPVRVAP
jgi:hypothetical protein